MYDIQNILRIFKEAKDSILKEDTHAIKRLSDQTIHSATISQDSDCVIVAVLVYTIGKILERESYKKLDGWEDFYKYLMGNWDIAIKQLEKNDVAGFRNTLGEIRNYLNTITGDLSNYIKDIFRKAEINKSFKLYEHGLSAEQTAKLLGISLWDLSSYIGYSTISEASIAESLPEKTRIKYAEEIFS